MFDKRLGGTSPKNLPGKLWGLAVDKDGCMYSPVELEVVMLYGVVNLTTAVNILRLLYIRMSIYRRKNLQVLDILSMNTGQTCNSWYIY